MSDTELDSELSVERYDPVSNREFDLLVWRRHLTK